MDIWKIEKPFDYQTFFSNLTPHAVCYLVIRHSGNYCAMYPHELKLVCEWDFLIDRDTNVHVAFRMRFKNPKKFAFWFLYFCLWSKSWRNSHFQTKLLHNKSCAKWKHSTLTKTCWKLSENIHKLKYFKNWPLNDRDLGHFWVSFTLMIKGQQKTILFFHLLAVF